MDPLHQIIAAVKSADAGAVRKLLRKDPKLAGARDETGDTVLLMALYSGAAEVRDAILACGPDVNFFEAAALGRIDLVEQSLNEFPELIHAFSHDGFTGLHLAAFFGHGDVAAFLLDRGADVDAVSRNQTIALLATPLHSAIAGGRTAVAKLLLGRGAGVNARQEGGYTPLHLAALLGDPSLVGELLDRGARKDARSDAGETPLGLAREKQLTDIEQLLS